jgi:hemoglobin
MLKDERVAAYFANTDMTKQIQRQKQFITLVTGGPNNYEGTDMKAAHCKHAIGQF